MRAPHAVIIVAKRPLPGTVKTRLCPPLTPLQAADLALALYLDTLESVRAVPGAEVLIGYAPAADSHRRWFAESAPGCALLPQGEGGLGARLRNLLQQGFRLGYERLALIGSDMPHISPAVVREALDSVRRAGGIALGPAEDGGYYLLALDRVIPSLFEHMPWGEAALLERTLEAARALVLPVRLLPEGRDIDTPEDLQWLSGSPLRARLRHTARFLEASRTQAT